MIIAYEPETKKAIEKVIDVFKDYILTSIHFDLLWSDKLGYIYIGIDNVRGSIGDTGCCVVNCGEELFDKLVWEKGLPIGKIVLILPIKRVVFYEEDLHFACFGDKYCCFGSLFGR